MFIYMRKHTLHLLDQLIALSSTKMAASTSSSKTFVALVTGGASGLGRATVKRLVGRGFKVGILDLPLSEGADLVKELGADNVHFCPVDVASREEVRKAVSAVPAKFGHLHVVVNCAGLSYSQKLFSTSHAKFMSEERIERMIQVNLHGTINVVKYSVPHLLQNEPDRDRQRGLVINTSSIAAFEGQIGQAVYAATKGAIASMTLPLARDYSQSGIRFMAIAPGLFQTRRMASLPEKARHGLARLVPSPARLGHPDEFAALVEHIVDSPYLNGQVIRLDGGLRMAP